MILISNLTLNIKDGSTIASTEIYGADKKTYINIGSGNVFNLSWTTPTFTNDTLDHYKLVIKRHDIALNIYYDIFEKNIGLVNKFSVNSLVLPTVPLQYKLSIYVAAHGKQGNVITSNVVGPYVSKGSGTYVKVESDAQETYMQPIMKRALAFANVASSAAATMSATSKVLTDSNGYTLLDADSKVLSTTPEADLVSFDGFAIKDKEGKALFATATKVLNSVNGWNVMQEGYTKGADGEWHVNDIKYEVLQLRNETTGKYEILTDASGTEIYIL